MLYRVGDRFYPLIAILEGEVAIVDAAGNEIVRHGNAGFLGEMNLLTGQTVFVSAVVTQPLRYIEVDREVLRQLLFDDSSLSELLLATFVERREALQQWQGIGIEVVGPRDSRRTRDLVEYAKHQRLPYSWLDPAEERELAVRWRRDGDRAASVARHVYMRKTVGVGRLRKVHG